jgi:hypothetical protein
MRSEHVIGPHTEDPVENLMHAVEEQKKTWPKVDEFFGQPLWFIQPFLAQLLQIGEVRVVIVGGRMAYTLSTKPRLGVSQGWGVTDKPFLRPVHQHSYNPDAPQGSRYTELTAEDVPMEEFDDIKNLLEHYALTMLGRLITLEEREMGRMSGLRVFVRLDVSVFRESRTGAYRFFVNEITRGHGAGLFQEWVSHEKADFLFQHLAEVFHLVASNKLYLNPPPPPPAI